MCWFGSRNGLLVFFVVPISTLLVVNLVLFAVSVRQIQAAAKASRVAVQKPANSRLVVIYVKLSILMGFGWFIGYIAALTDWTFLWYLFIIINSLQGTFICLAFVATRQVVRLIRDRYHRSIRTTTKKAAAETEGSGSGREPASSAPTQSDYTTQTVVITSAV
jgi:hypothetical protein